MKQTTMRALTRFSRRLALVAGLVLCASLVALILASAGAGTQAKESEVGGGDGLQEGLPLGATWLPAEFTDSAGMLNSMSGRWGSVDSQSSRLLGRPGMVPRLAPLTMSADDRWDGEFGSPGMNDVVRDLATDGSGNLYAGGAFTKAGGLTVNRIAVWDGSGWSALDGGMDGVVIALARDGHGKLYAGGDFDTAGTVSASNVAVWDGDNWAPLGGGTNGTVRALVVDGSGNLYVGGHFTTAGSTSAQHIAMWNGSQWSALGNGLSDAVLALAIDGADIYAGGFFSKAGDVTVNYVAKWDGHNWFALGPGMDSHVYALTVSGGNIYAGGAFTKSGTRQVNYLAQWNGTRWSPLGGGMDDPVAALAVDGSHVYAGGYFKLAGTVTAKRIAMWDGTTWSALGRGMDGVVETLAMHESGDLYAGGYFTKAGGKPSAHIARWSKYRTHVPLLLRDYQSAPPPAPPPAPPSSLTAVPVSADTIELEWVDNSDNETKFIIENSPDGVTFAHYGKTDGPDITRVWDIELKPGSTHCYRVRARNANGASNPSNTACATTDSNGPPAPLSDLTAQVISSTRILLTWTNNSSCEGYRVYESIDGGSFSFAGTVTPGDLPGAYVDVWAGHTYAYRVTAYNGFGESPYADAPVSNSVATPATTSSTITRFNNNTVYPVISLQIDGVEQFSVQPQGIPPATYYQKELAVGTHSYRAATGFWSGGQRIEMYIYQGSVEQQNGVAGQVQFNNPTIAQILTRFGTSGYYAGDYWTGTLPNSAAFRFYSDGTYTFYRNGVAQGTGSYSLVSYPGNFLTTFQVTGSQNAQGQMDERTGHFYMRNGPSDWPTIQYNYDGP